MARHILIVEQSLTLRKILQGIILANIGDAVVHEAWTIQDAIRLAETMECNLALLHLDTSVGEWRSFFKKAVFQDGEKKFPVVILTSHPDASVVKDALKAGASETISIPCSPESLVGVINRVCDPVSLRFTKRYCIPDSNVRVEQRHYALGGKLLNISKGGLLCEWEWEDGFQWYLPTMISVSFNMEKESLTVRGLLSILVQLSVTNTHSDHSPRTVRTSFKFINISDEDLNALEEVFEKAEKEQKLFSA